MHRGSATDPGIRAGEIFCVFPVYHSQKKREAPSTGGGPVLGFGAMGRSKRVLLLPPLFLALHLNYWMWDDARIVLGLPANLLYHVVLSIFLSLVLLVLVRRAWPRYLDED
jgi:hypothetical protein